MLTEERTTCSSGETASAHHSAHCEVMKNTNSMIRRCARLGVIDLQTIQNTEFSLQRDSGSLRFGRFSNDAIIHQWTKGAASVNKLNDDHVSERGENIACFEVVGGKSLQERAGADALNERCAMIISRRLPMEWPLATGY